MPEELPEHIDQIEDFYRSAFSEDTEMPSPELWGKVAAKLEAIPSVINYYNWKNGLIRLAVEALLISSLTCYIHTRTDSNTAPIVPEQNPVPVSETPEIIEQDLPVSTQPEVFSKSADRNNDAAKLSKETIEKAQQVITEELVEKEPEPKAEEVITTPEVVPVEEVIKKEVPVVNEKQDLYSKLKKKHITDSSKSLFIEKKK